MTLIIDDTETCQCGAYLEDNGTCANGHIQLEVRHPDDVIQDLHEKRLKVASIQKQADTALAALEKIPEYQQLQEVHNQLDAASQDAQAAEDLARSVVALHYGLTEEKKGDLWGIRITTKLMYDQEEALVWASENCPDALKLNKKEFEKVAKSLREVTLTTAITPNSFVTFVEEPVVTLSGKIGQSEE